MGQPSLPTIYSVPSVEMSTAVRASSADDGLALLVRPENAHTTWLAALRLQDTPTRAGRAPRSARRCCGLAAAASCWTFTAFMEIAAETSSLAAPAANGGR